jgi:hypothetical protein
MSMISVRQSLSWKQKRFHDFAGMHGFKCVPHSYPLVFDFHPKRMDEFMWFSVACKIKVGSLTAIATGLAGCGLSKRVCLEVGSQHGGDSLPYSKARGIEVEGIKICKMP